MAIVYQESGFTCIIEASFKGPPYVRVTKGKGHINIRIGFPETELPQVDEYKGVTRKDADIAQNIIQTYQEKFWNACERTH